MEEIRGGLGWVSPLESVNTIKRVLVYQQLYPLPSGVEKADLHTTLLWRI